ncbi:alkyl sulfatase C-terminal domain-containing protein (plasmid) [Rhodococcus qingshengii]
MNPRTEAKVDLSVTFTKPELLGLLTGASLEKLENTGDSEVFTLLLGLLDVPDPAFPIVTL